MSIKNIITNLFLIFFNLIFSPCRLINMSNICEQIKRTLTEGKNLKRNILTVYERHRFGFFLKSWHSNLSQLKKNEKS